MRFSQVRALGAAILFAVSCGALAAASPRFDKLEEKLKIRPEQKEQFDAAVASTQRALVSVALIAMQIKQGLGEELQKPRPDLRAFFEAHRSFVEQSKPLFREMSEEWKKLYETLDDDQVEIARRFVQESLASLFFQQGLDGLLR